MAKYVPGAEVPTPPVKVTDGDGGVTPPVKKAPPKHYVDPSTGERVPTAVYEAGQKALAEARVRDEAEEPKITKDTKPDRPGGQVATIDGKEYYILGSTMYKMGYETPEEYVEAQRGRRVEYEPGKVRWEYGPKHVTVKTFEGLKHITREQAKTLVVAKDKDRFQHMIRLGVIPQGAEYVELEDGWGYRAPTPIKEVPGLPTPQPRYMIYDYDENKLVEVSPEEYRKREAFYLIAPFIGPPGVPGKITPQEAERRYKEFQHKIQTGEIIKLGDDTYISEEVYEKLPSKAQEVVLTSGLAGMERAVKLIRPYEKDGSYNVTKILAEALYYKDEQLRDAAEILFGPEITNEADEVIRQEYYPSHWEEGTFPRKLSELWRKVTPWKEELGETALTTLGKPAFPEGMRPGTPLPLPEVVERKAEEVAVWFRDKWLPQVQQITEQFSGQIRGTKLPPPEYDWFREGVEVESPIPKELATTPAGKVLYAVPETMFMLGFTIPGIIAGYIGESLAYAAAQQPEASDLAMATLAAGIGEWFVGRPKAFVTDPFYEIPHTALILVGPAKIAKMVKATRVKIDPRAISDTAISLQADIARVVRPEGMEFPKARSLIEAVETVWAGKVPKQLKELDPLSQAIFTAVMKHRDVVIKGPEGSVIGRVSPFQRTVSQTTWHATQNIGELVKGIADKGYMTVKPTGKYKVLFTSQQFPQTFLAPEPGMPLIEPGGIAIRFSTKDFRPLPKSVRNLTTTNEMRAELVRLAETRKLEPGIYPIFKEYGWPPKLELEMFVSPGTKLYPTTPTWYAPKLHETASTRTTSMVGALDPGVIKLGRVQEVIRSLEVSWAKEFSPWDFALRQRSSYEHFEVGGLVRNRVTNLVKSPKGILLVMDKTETAYGLPGGRVNPWADIREGRLGRFQDAAYGQVHSETGIRTADLTPLGTYLGKVNRHSFSGSRVYESAALNTNLHLKGTEIKDALWWDGKSSITVYPATFDILSAVASKLGLDMAAVKIYTKIPQLMRTRDTAFASRVAQGKKPFDYTAKELNAIELKELNSYAQSIRVAPEMYAGQEIPILWLTTEAAKAEGLGVPPLKQLYMAEIVNIVTTPLKWLPWRRTQRRLAEKGEAVATSPYSYQVLVLKEAGNAVRKADEIALNRAKRGEKYETALRDELNKVVETYREESLPYRPSREVRAVGLEYLVEPEALGIYEVTAVEEALPEVISPRIREPEPEVEPEPIVEPEPEVAEPEPVVEEPLEPISEEPLEPIVAEPVTEVPPEPEPEPVMEMPPEIPPELPPEHPPEFPPEYPPEYPPITPIIVSIRGPRGEKAKDVEIPSGSIAWRMGALKGGDVIKYIPPPYTQLKPITLIGKRPAGWRDKGRTPQETIQVIGAARDVPKRVSIDLGIADIQIIDGKRIEFTGSGLETDVGTRIPSPTTGMSIPASPLKFGTSFEEALSYVPKDEAQREFVERQMQQMISEMSVEEFVKRVKEAELLKERVDELLEYMPDREREFARTLLAEEELFVPVGHEQYVQARPSWRKGATRSALEVRGVKSLILDEISGLATFPKGTLTKGELQRRRALGRKKIKNQNHNATQVVNIRDIL